MATGFSSDNLKVVGKERVVIHGKFSPAGTSAVTGVDGHGFTVARTGVGAYLITLKKPYPELISFNAGVREAAGTPTFAQFGDYDSSAGTIQLRVAQGTTTMALADLAADADNEVSFELTFRNYSGSY